MQTASEPKSSRPSTRKSKDKTPHLLKGDLLARDWTPALIDKFLGKPDQIDNRYGGDYYLYARSRVLAAEATPGWQEAVKRRKERKPIPPKSIDLLAAIFAVTRSAKRCRDAAQSCYRNRKYGFATMFRKKKENLYALKDQGIAAAFSAGRIMPIEQSVHLVDYRGEGYCFHSTLLPNSTTIPQAEAAEPIRVEAKPRDAAEAKLKDAVFTLEALPDVPETFTRFDPPQPKWEEHRSSRPSYDSHAEDDDDRAEEEDESSAATEEHDF